MMIICVAPCMDSQMLSFLGVPGGFLFFGWGLIAFPKMIGTLSPNGGDINLCCSLYKYPIFLFLWGP